MTNSRLSSALTLALGFAALACGGGKSDQTSGTVSPGYIPPGGGNGGSSSALQSDGTLLLKGVIRDFKANYPDMEPCTNSGKSCDSGHNEQHPGCVGSNECIVGTILDSQSKPQYVGPASGTLTTTGPANFANWFNKSTYSMPQDLPLTLIPDGNGAFTYRNLEFFPIDGQLFGNEGKDANGVSHNFNFTTEFHLKFTYQSGQTFTFRGDDDLWVFVDGNLQIDLGGIHAGQEATLQLDTLGLAPGTDHDFAIFYCERHVVASELEIQTSIQFSRSITVN